MQKFLAFLLRFLMLPLLAAASLYFLNEAALGFGGSAVAVLAPMEDGWTLTFLGEDYALARPDFLLPLFYRGIPLLCRFFSIVRELIL